MKTLATVLSNAATKVAKEGSMACIGLVWEEPVCPEEML